MSLPRVSIDIDNGHERASGGISTIFVGFGLHQAWIYCAMFGTADIFGSPIAGAHGLQTHSSLVYLISIAVYAACLITCGAMDRKLGRLIISRRPYVLAALLTCVGTLMTLASSLSGPLGVAAIIGAGALTGIGSSILLIGWGIIYSHRTPATIVVNTSLAIALAAAIYSVILNQIPAPFSAIIASCLPLLELAVLWHYIPVPFSENNEVPVFNPLSVVRGKFVLKFGVPVLIFGLALGALRETTTHSVLNSGTPSEQMLLLLAAGMVTTLLLMGILILGRSENQWTRFFRVLLPLVAVAVFMIPLAGNEALSIAGVILFIVYMCFEALIWIFFGEISQQYRLSPILVFGLGRGFLGIGSLAMSMFTIFTPSNVIATYFGQVGWLIIILLAMIFAYIFLPHEKEIRSITAPDRTSYYDAAQINKTRLDSRKQKEAQAGAEPAPDQEQGGPTLSLFRTTCEGIADRYLLSRRETEVLFLLAKGFRSTTIQEKLCVSEGTAKTHISHIYRKLDVHSHRELLEMVEAEQEQLLKAD